MTTGKIDLDALFGDSDAPTFWLDRDGRVGWLNAAARAVVAATHDREAAVGDSMFDLAVPSTRADFEANFAEALAGRATTTYNLMVFAGGFGAQWGMGLLIDLLTHLGQSEADALRIVFGGLLVAQAASLAWFFACRPRYDAA